MNNFDDQDNEPIFDGNEEQCPICKAVQIVGSNPCEHFVGVTWDGDIIWSEIYDAFSNAWSEFAADREQFRNRPKLLFRRLRSAARKAGFDISLITYGDWVDFSPFHVFQELADLRAGNLLIRDAMPSGSGYSLFHESPNSLRELASQYQELSALAKRILLKQRK